MIIAEESYISLWESWSLDAGRRNPLVLRPFRIWRYFKTVAKFAISVSVVTYYGLHTFLVITP